MVSSPLDNLVETDLVAGSPVLHRSLVAVWNALDLGSKRLMDVVLGSPEATSYERNSERLRSDYLARKHNAGEIELFEQMFVLRSIYDGSAKADAWTGLSAQAQSGSSTVEPVASTAASPVPVVHESTDTQSDAAQVRGAKDGAATAEHPVSQPGLELEREPASKSLRKKRQKRRGTVGSDSTAGTTPGFVAGHVPGGGENVFASSIEFVHGGQQSPMATRSVHKVSVELTDSVQQLVTQRLAESGVTFKGAIPLGTLVNLALISLLGLDDGGSDVRGDSSVSVSKDDALVLDVLSSDRDAGWQDEIGAALDGQSEMIDELKKTVDFIHRRSVQQEKDSFLQQYLMGALLGDRLSLGDIPSGARLDDVVLHSEKHEALMAHMTEQSAQEHQRQVAQKGRAR